MSSRRVAVLLGLVILSVGPLLGAQSRGRRGAVPPPAPLFEVHERGIAELQAAQTEGRVTSRQLVQS